MKSFSQFAYIFCFLCCCIATEVLGQESIESEQEEGRHILSLAIGHSNLSKGFSNGEREWLTVPSWEFSYNYRLSEKFLIGLHADLIMEQYAVKGYDGELLLREYPYSLILVGTYKFHERWGVELGGGLEISEEENLNLIKLGLEYAVPLGKGFESVFLAGYDLMYEAYDSYNLGIGISKAL